MWNEIQVTNGMLSFAYITSYLNMLIHILFYQTNKSSFILLIENTCGKILKN